MFSINITVSKAPWLDNPNIRWDAGLRRAGTNFRQHLQRPHYPAPPPLSRYVRTYLTADKAGYTITDPGREMQFGSTFYLPFILFGTRKWQGWPGKLDELITAMRNGFSDGIIFFHDDPTGENPSWSYE